MRFGSVTLSTTSRWAKTPGDGVEGRVALLRHEVAHALGLGHVTSDRELMFPIHTAGVSPLTPQNGDIAGLREQAGGGEAGHAGAEHEDPSSGHSRPPARRKSA